MSSMVLGNSANRVVIPSVYGDNTETMYFYVFSRPQISTKYGQTKYDFHIRNTNFKTRHSTELSYFILVSNYTLATKRNVKKNNRLHHFC